MPSIPKGALSTSDGHILLYGGFTHVNGQPRSQLVRISKEGLKDESFVPPPIPNSAGIRKMVVEADGNMLAITGPYFWYYGETEDPGRLVRLNPNGVADESFNFPQSLACDVRDVLPLASGQVLAAGSFTNNGIVCGVMRFNRDGSIDENFNTASLQNIPAVSITEQPDKKLIVWPKSGSVVRLAEDGSPSHDFPWHLPGGNGRAWWLEDAILLAGSSAVLDLEHSGGYKGFFHWNFNSGLAGAHAYSSVRLPSGDILLDGYFEAFNSGFASSYGLGLIDRASGALVRTWQLTEFGVDLLCATSTNEVLAVTRIPSIIKIRLAGIRPPSIELQRSFKAAQLSVTSEIWTNVNVLVSTNLSDWSPFHQMQLQPGYNSIMDTNFSTAPRRYFKAVVGGTASSQ